LYIEDVLFYLYYPMFYIINGNYIGYSEFNLHELTKKIKESDFIFVKHFTVDFWLNTDFYHVGTETALSTRVIESIKLETSNLEALNKEDLLISFE